MWAVQGKITEGTLSKKCPHPSPRVRICCWGSEGRGEVGNRVGMGEGNAISFYFSFFLFLFLKKSGKKL